MSSTTWRGSRTRSALRVFPSLWLSVSIAASSAVLAGCGGGGEQAAPQARIPRVVAEDLARRSDHVAALLASSDRCGAREEAAALHQAAIDAINAGQVPAALQEELMNGISPLVTQIECVPPPPQEEADEDNGKGKGKGKKKGKKGDGDD